MAKGKGKGKGKEKHISTKAVESTAVESTAVESTAVESTAVETTAVETTPIRRSCAGDVVNLRFNPATDVVLSVFTAGSILPCVAPAIGSPGATAFISCLLANGFEIQGIEALTPTDVLVTLTRC